MIEFVKGNLLEAETEALVNTVNTVGVMGKGIALQFKNRFPHNYKVYTEACKNQTFTIGQVLVVQEGDLMQRKFIVNFPTKAHWKGASKIEYISSGLIALKNSILKHNIQSIAIPPYVCGIGGLDWAQVKTRMVNELSDLNVRILIYEPNDQIKQILQKEEMNKSATLTPARAMLLYLLFSYEQMGEPSSLFVANKLAFFLQSRGEKLRLKFEAHHYGPYSVQLNHVLQYLNGVYLKGLEQNVAEAFEPLTLNYDKYDEVEAFVDTQLSHMQKERLKDVLKIIHRFESSLSIELLSSVSYIMQEEGTTDYELVKNRIASWNARKSNLFKDHHIKIAYDHLVSYGNSLPA